MNDKKPNTRSSMQLRRKESRSGGRDEWYNPERDMAYVGPAMIGGAVEAVDCLPFSDVRDTEEYKRTNLREPWLEKFLDDNDITYASLIKSEAPKLLAEALNSIIGLENPPAAMKAAGFDKLPAAIQMLFYARMGQVLLASVWAGVKDVGQPDSAPPLTFQEYLSDVNEAFQGFHKAEQAHESDNCTDGGDRV